MGNRDLPAPFFGQRVEHMEQNHRIHATRNGDEDFLSALEKVAVLNVRFDALEQIGHALMLSQPRNGAISMHQLHAIKPEGIGGRIIRRSRGGGRGDLVAEIRPVGLGEISDKLQLINVVALSIPRNFHRIVCRIDGLNIRHEKL